MTAHPQTHTTAPPAIDTATVFDFAATQLDRLVTHNPGRIPVFTSMGRWHFDQDAWAPPWTGGFLAGQLWILADHTDNDQWRRHAEQYSTAIEQRKTDHGTHDIGFLFTPSWGRWHEVDPSRHTRDVLITAGRTLAASYNTAGRYIRSWVDPGSTFIDIMMNLDIIFQAAELDDDPALRAIATNHALTTRRHLVRGDGTTAHEGWFDPATGEFLRTATHQGFRADSSWVRGLTWAIYGYTQCFERTGDHQFLDTARHLADTYLTRTGDALVPPNDWEDPHPEYPYEASAACIAAASMLRLATAATDTADRYASYGTRILARLCTPDFLALNAPGWEGLIQQTTYHRRHQLGVQESTMWGDYYFLDALHRYTRSTT